jgi:hypothetical protein
VLKKDLRKWGLEPRAKKSKGPEATVADFLNGKIGNQCSGAVLHQNMDKISFSESQRLQAVCQNVDLVSKGFEGNGFIIKLEIGFVLIATDSRVKISSQIHGTSLYIIKSVRISEIS